MAIRQNKITIDKLADMVATGFEGVDKKFEVMASDISELKSKVSKIDYRLDEVYEIVVHLEEGEIMDLQKRVGVLEKTVKGFAKQV